MILVVNGLRGSLPHRQLRNDTKATTKATARSLPHRQLRNYKKLCIFFYLCSLPHRYLIKSRFSRSIEPGEFISKSRLRKGERGLWQRRSKAIPVKTLYEWSQNPETVDAQNNVGWHEQHESQHLEAPLAGIALCSIPAYN